jgi:hypothetical protein
MCYFIQYPSTYSNNVRPGAGAGHYQPGKGVTMNEMTGQKLQFEPNGRKFFEIEQFLENTPDANKAVYEKGKLTIFNRQSEVILNYIAKDTLGLPVSQF